MPWSDKRLPFLLGVWVTPLFAQAKTDEAPRALSWELGPGAQGCPAESYVEESFERLLGQSIADALGESRLRFRVSRSSSGYRLVISLSRNGEETSREVEHPDDCVDLVQAGTVMAAIAIDPEALSRSSTLESPAEESAPQGEEPVSDVEESKSVEGTVDPEEVTVSERSLSFFGVRIDAGAELGTLPQTTAEATLTGLYGASFNAKNNWRVEGRVGAVLPTVARLASSPSIGADFSRWSAGLGTCWQYRAHPLVEAGLCLGFEGGQTRAAAFGFEGAQTVSELWAVASTGTRVSLAFSDVLWGVVGAELTPVLRRVDSVVVGTDGEEIALFEQPRLGGSVGAGLEFRF